MNDASVLILTFHNGHNPGAFMQAYCLQQAVETLGRRAEIIDYFTPAQRAARTRSWIPRRRPWRYFSYRKNFQRYSTTFDRFALTDRMAGTEDLTRLGDDRTVLYGSDEIWNVRNVTTGFDRSFFGAGPESWKRIAYAPSVGAVDQASDLPAEAVSGLGQFDALSVRDENSRRVIAEATGRRPDLVVDPTLLHPIPRESIGRDFSDVALVYMNPLRGAHIAAIRAWAASTRTKLVSIFYPLGWCDEHIDQQDPLKVVDAFSTAGRVITNTFHGTMFSIAHQRPFVTHMNRLKQHKLRSVLEQFSLGDRCTTDAGELAAILNRDLDYEPAAQKVARLAETSRQYLRDHLVSDQGTKT